jgi:hypothetical protein
MSNNRQLQILAALVAVPLVLSLATIALTTDDVMAGKKKNVGNGASSSGGYISGQNNGPNGGDTNGNSASSANGADGQGANGANGNNCC